MNRDYVIIWREELDSDTMFDEYCQMKNAEMIDDDGEAVEGEVGEGDAMGVKFYTVPKRNKIVVEITEGDVDDFKDIVNGYRTVSWCFDTQDGTPIDIKFVAEELK